MEDDVFAGESTLERRSEDEVKSKNSDIPQEIPIMIGALKKMYKEKLLPLEQRFKYNEFASPHLKDAYFDAKPFVLLIGQYSVGKTTFIKFLLERDFPGVRIGPEPTTDRFMVIMGASMDRTIPGNALVADASKPFTQLTKYGMGFLNKFECAECSSPILEKISFIDTPGILSGEKQRTGRGYSFPVMCEWFAGRCDRILLLFDAHKLDISDEMKETIDNLRNNDDKIRVVLNKADIPTQQLVRVYGALMWSLGKVFQTPEVLRVYVGSFWDQPLKEKENEKLMKLEQQDLLADLRSLPHNVAIRKVNELIKRARRAKIHALIICHLKAQFGTFGKGKKQQKLLDNLNDEFKKVMEKHSIPKNDFPNLKKFKKVLAKFEINKFPKMDKKTMENLNIMLNTDMPKLMSMVPSETDSGESESKDAMLNPFAEHDALADVIGDWAIKDPGLSEYRNMFSDLPRTNGKLSGKNAMPIMLKSGLSKGVLGKIWGLGDIDKDGFLDKDEFCVVMYLINCKKNGVIDDIPKQLPNVVIPPSKRYLFKAKE